MTARAGGPTFFGELALIPACARTATVRSPLWRLTPQSGCRCTARLGARTWAAAAAGQLPSYLDAARLLTAEHHDRRVAKLRGSCGPPAALARQLEGIRCPRTLRSLCRALAGTALPARRGPTELPACSRCLRRPWTRATPPSSCRTACDRRDQTAPVGGPARRHLPARGGGPAPAPRAALARRLPRPAHRGASDAAVAVAAAAARAVMRTALAPLV